MASANPFTGTAWGRTTAVYPSTVAQSSAVAATQLVDLVNSKLALDGDSCVLDLGAGTGAATFAVVRNYSSKVLATDISEQMLQTIVAQKESQVATQILDALEVRSLGLRKFSHVFSTFMLQFLLQPNVVVSGVYDVLKPGGVVGLGLWYGRPLVLVIWEKACQTIEPSYQNEEDYLDPHAWTTPEQVKKQLEAAGFEDVSTNEIVLPFRFPSAEAFIDFMANGKNPCIQHVIEQWKGDRSAAMKAMGRICKEEYQDGKDITLHAINCTARKPLFGSWS